LTRAQTVVNVKQEISK